MRTDGRTDTTKIKVGFRNFAKAPKKKKILNHSMTSWIRHPISGHMTTRDFSSSVWFPSKTMISALTKRCKRLWDAATLSHQTSASAGTSVTAGVLRGATKETLQCIIAIEVVFIPTVYDINKSRLLYYRLRVMTDNEGSLEDSDDNFTEDESSTTISDG